MRWLICVSVAAGLAVAEEGLRAKDEREYALVQQTTAETDPVKRLEILNMWSKEYGDSALRNMRTQLYLQAHREAGHLTEAVEAAENVLAFAPEDFTAGYTLVSLAPALGDASTTALERAEGSARTLLDGGLAMQFEEGKRPANVPAVAWNDARRESQAASLRTLGWIAMQRKAHGEAEARLLEALGVEPASGQASYWLAQSVLAQREPAKNELAFFSLARAATLTGPGELPAESREKIHAYLKRTYEAFAGTLDGLEDLERSAATSVLPPPEMPRILSAQERKILADKSFCEEKPLECAYRTLRSALEGEGGEAVWAELRGKVTPVMRLYAVGNEPPDRPLELRMSSTKGGKTEVVLRLENRLREAVAIGRAVSVEGVAATFEREPFRLTLEQGKIVE